MPASMTRRQMIQGLAAMVDVAGHWVQQEQPEETSRLLIEFLRGV